MAQPITRITVATDLSARSDRAVERAFQLGRAGQLPVEILMILDDAMPDSLRAPLQEKAEAQLHELGTRRSDGGAFSINVQAGDPTKALITASNTPGTLLIMGPHRPRPFLDALRETTMQSVVRRSAAPVLLVTEPVLGPYAHVLSLIDFNAPADNALALGAQLAPEAKLRPYHAVHVPYSGMLETTGAVQMDLQQALHDDAVTHSKKWQAERSALAGQMEEIEITLAAPDGMIRQATADRSFDLLTAGAHGPVGAGRTLLGSLATDLMRNPPCDVLIGR